MRLTYSDSNNDASIEIISEKNYYPFGMTHKGYNNVVSSNSNSVAQKFGFGGKELQDELGLDWYDVSARNYDPALGRWMNLDPLAEQMRRHSPYILDLTTLFTGKTMMGWLLLVMARTHQKRIAEQLLILLNMIRMQQETKLKQVQIL
ncbi:RHS repeat domain-containing protein [Winogradskyella luteola]|uniref:RHS repeat-associated core domain-containing protein n=1 Tax=Winogradskyella luteola TaxID=2828330 RepID=A0A9X1JNB2_9FLAO|nr:hypothetical protein [Winogradskyella luteola]